MKPHVWLFIALAGITLTGPRLTAQTHSPAAVTLSELQTRLAEQVSQRRFDAGTFGVKIVSLESGKTIFERDAAKLFSPASNCKLYTTALALELLGGGYRIKTSLYSTAKPDRSGTLKGDLIIFGRGDFGFTPRSSSDDISQALGPLVAALRNAGIKRINGNIVGDESFFRGPPYGSGWNCDDLQFDYGAELSALTINGNVLKITAQPGERVGAPCRLSLEPATDYLTVSNRTQTVAAGGGRGLRCYRPLGENILYVTGQWPMGKSNYTGTVTIHNPAGLFVSLFKEALSRSGIKVDGKSRTVNWLDRQAAPLDLGNLVELGSVESRPVRDLVREINKPSQNLYTDLLLSHIGALTLTTNAGSALTSEDTGIEALNDFLARVGIRKGDVRFEEGSGLSRNNLATPNAGVALLTFMSRHAESAAYRDSLPIAGVDGTLRNRMRALPAAAGLHAKTGTLRWAEALSGYVTTAAGEPLAFSIMANRQATPVREVIDAIAVMLAEFSGRSDR